MNHTIIFDFLKRHNIPYTLFEHQPVFTVEEKPIVTAVNGIDGPGEIPQPHFKTLFLKDHKGKFFLISVTEEKRVDLKALSNVLACGRFSFGKPEELQALLHLTPGSVTPFGLLFDQENKVTFALDEDALHLQWVNFHPMRNDMTIALTPQDFLRSIQTMGHKTAVIHIPTKAIQSEVQR